MDNLNLNLLDKKYNKACEIFSKEIVEEVIETLNFINDLDTLYILYKDNNQHTHMGCVIFLYFED